MSAPSSLAVRVARRDDAEYLAQLANAHNRFDGLADNVFSAAVIHRHLFGRVPHYRCHVAASGSDPIVGYVSFSPLYVPERAHPGLFITDLFVDSTARQQGAGRKLVHSVIAIAQNEGFQTVAWTAWANNARARRFYLGLGALETAISYFEIDPNSAKIS